MTHNLGLKRNCVACAAKFYDLGKNPAKCPKCGTVNDVNIVSRRRGRAKAVVAADLDDPLLKEKAKMETRQAKAKKPVKEIEGVDLDAFEDIEPLAGEDDIEEIEEDDMETLESLEEIEEGDEDDLEEGLEEAEMGDEVLIDDINEEEEEEEDEDEDEDDSSSRARKPVKKPVKVPAKSKAPVKKSPTKKR